MSVTFVHTADWQLGKPFANVLHSQKRAILQRERLEAIERIAAVAKSEHAEFAIVAGDIFDSTSPSRATVSAACAAIGAIGVPVFAIPGNHDHAGPESVWNQPFFAREKEALAPNLTVFQRSTPHELQDAVLLPCPALRRHESQDVSAWLASVPFESIQNKPRIVLAHGNVRGFAMKADDADGMSTGTNEIDLARLPDEELDYVALGDWHGAKQIGTKAWYSGTPEPDRFPRGESNRPGHVLVVTAERGGSPAIQLVSTSRIGWHRLDFELSEDVDIARLESSVEALVGGRAQADALLLELRGGIGIEARTRLDEMLETWEARLLRLQLSDRTIIVPTVEELDALTRRASDPLISRVAAKLVILSEGSDEQAVVARTALRELHAACRGL